MREIRGLVVATPTPFDDDGKIDFGYVARHLDFIRQRGADAVVPSGTNGEGPSMTIHERRELIRETVRSGGGMAVVAGTGCACLSDTIELTRSAEQLGADAALVVPPFFFRNASLEGLVEYYSQVLRSTELPIFLYNIPTFSGIEIADELVERLLDFPNLAGVKDSDGVPDRTRRYCDKFPHLSIFYGADHVMAAMQGSGVKGSVSGLANCFPEVISDALKKCEAGRGDESQPRVNELCGIMARYPLFAANKHALTLRGFPPTRVRPPLVDLNDEQKASLERELKEARFP